MTRDLDWLQNALSALDLVFFEGHLEEFPVTIGWLRWRHQPYKDCSEFTYGQYWKGDIRINRVLACNWVPDYVVVATIYHEALHHVVGLDHDQAFRYAEQKFPHHLQATVWELNNIDVLMKTPNPFKRVAP